MFSQTQAASPKTCNTVFIFLWEVILVIGRDTQPKLFQTKFELVHRETGRDRKCYAVIVFYPYALQNENGPGILEVSAQLAIVFRLLRRDNHMVLM